MTSPQTQQEKEKVLRSHIPFIIQISSGAALDNSVFPFLTLSSVSISPTLSFTTTEQSRDQALWREVMI